MNAILDFLNDVSTPWWTYAWHSTWQSALVGGILLAGVYLGRRWPAPLRCGLLLLALAKFAVPPMLSIPIGLLGLAGPTIAHPRGAAPERIQPAETPTGLEPFRAPESMAFLSIPQQQQPISVEMPVEFAAVKIVPSNSPSTTRATPASMLMRLGWKSALLILHLVGSLVTLVWIAHQWTRLRRTVRHADRLGPARSRSLSGLLEAPVPLTLTLSFGEREPKAPTQFCSQVSGTTTASDSAMSGDRFTLSPRERAGVREKEGLENHLPLTAQDLSAVGLVTDGILADQLVQLAQQLGVRRLPRLIISPQIATPIALGILRPTIMLPLAVVERLPVAEIRTILAHELAHFRRGDLWVNALQLLLLAVWWFNPVLWLLHRALRNVREDCCDDLLLARGLTTNEAYCDTLMHAATELSGKGTAGPGLVFAESLHPLGDRVARLMDRTIRRVPNLSLAGSAMVVILGALLLPGLRSQEAKPSAPENNPRSSRREEALSSKSSITSRQSHINLTSAESLEVEFAKLRWVGEDNLYFEEMQSLSRQMRQSAIPFLLQKLERKPNESDTGKLADARRNAAMALGFIGAEPERVVPKLVEALEDEAAMHFAADVGRDVRMIRVSAVAADALGRFGPKAASAIPALIEVAKFGNPRALVALARIAPESKEVLATLEEALKDFTKGNGLPLEGEYRLAALTAVGITAEHNPAAVQLLAANLGDGEPTFREGAANSLVRLSRGFPDVKALVDEKLKHGPTRENIHLAAALAKGGTKRDEAYSVLVSGVRSEQSDLKAIALEGIAAFGPRAREVAPIALETARKEKGTLQRNGLRALWRIAKDDPETVAVVIECLSSPDERLKMEAFAAFGTLGRLARPAEPVLLDALRHSLPQVRTAAARALGEIGAAPEKAIPALKGALRDPDHVVQTTALISMGKFGEAARELLSMIIGMLDGTNAWAAAIACGNFGPLAEPAVPALIKALESPHSGAGGNAANALGKIGPKAKAAIPALTKVMKTADGMFRRNAAFALWQIDGHTNIVGMLIEALRSDSVLDPLERLNAKSTRLWHLKQLEEIGPAAKTAIPALNEVVKGTDDDLRAAAEDALNKIQSDSKLPGAKTSAAFSADLFNQLELFGSQRKRSQARLLAEFLRGQPTVVPFLIDELQNQTRPTRGEAIERRRKASWILTEIGPTAKAAIPALVKALEDDDERVAQQAASALGAMGTEAKEAIPALLEALKFKNEAAARALVTIAPQSPQIANALIDAFDDGSYPSRQQLLYVLSDLKTEKTRLEATLLAAQQESDAQIRSTSAYALYRIQAKSKEAMAAINAWKQQNVAATQPPPKESDTLAKHIATLRNSPPWPDAFKAIQQIIQLGPDASEAVPVLIDYLKDRGSPLRLSAASALGAIGPAAKEAVPALIDALKEDDRGVSGNAARALGQIGPDAKAAVPALQEALRDSDQRLRSQAAVSLWRVDPALIPTSVAVLTELLDQLPGDFGGGWLYMAKVLGEIGAPAKSGLTVLTRLFEESNDFQRWAAAAAICRIEPSRTEGILPQMVQALNDRSCPHRAAVASSLGEIGASARSAVPALTVALKDDDPSLRDAAAKALKKIVPETDQ